jgi:hypothetical protein
VYGSPIVTATETVSVALALFDVSAAAVTVTVYVPAAVGVQATALLPLLTQPEPDDGLTDTVKSVFSGFTVRDRVSPTRILNDCVIEMLTTLIKLLLLPPLFPPPPQADRVSSSMKITVEIKNPFFARYTITFSLNY